MEHFDNSVLNQIAQKYGLKEHLPTDSYIFSIDSELYDKHTNPFVIRNKLSMIKFMQSTHHQRRTDGKAVTLYENPFFFADPNYSQRVIDQIRSELVDTYKLYDRTYPTLSNLTDLFQQNNSIRYSDKLIGIDGIISSDHSINLSHIKTIDQQRLDGLRRCAEQYPLDLFYPTAAELEPTAPQPIWGPKKLRSAPGPPLAELTPTDFEQQIQSHLMAQRIFNPYLTSRQAELFEQKIRGKMFVQSESAIQTVRPGSTQYVFGHFPDLVKYTTNPSYFGCMQIKMPHIGLESCDPFVEWTPQANMYYALKAFYDPSQDFVRFILEKDKFFPRRKDRAMEDTSLFSSYPIGMITIDFVDDRLATKHKPHPTSTLYYFIFYNVSIQTDYTATYDWPGHAYTPTRIKIYDIYKRPVQRKLIFYGNSITYTEFNNFVTYFHPKIFRLKYHPHILFIQTYQSTLDSDTTSQMGLEQVYYDTIVNEHHKHFMGIWADTRQIESTYKSHPYVYYIINPKSTLRTAQIPNSYYYFVSVSPMNMQDKIYFGLREIDMKTRSQYVMPKRPWAMKGGDVIKPVLRLCDQFAIDHMGADMTIATDSFVKYNDLTMKIWKKIMPDFSKFNITATIMYPYIYVTPQEYPVGYLSESYVKTYDRLFKYVVIDGSDFMDITKNPSKILGITEYQPRSFRFFRHYEVLFNHNLINSNDELLLLTDGEVDFAEAAIYFATKNNIAIKSFDVVYDPVQSDSHCATTSRKNIDYIKQFDRFTDIAVLPYDNSNSKTYDLIVEQTRCRFKNIEWFYEYSAFPPQLRFIIYALRHLNTGGKLIFNVKNIVLKIQADLIIILQSVFDKVELYDVEIVPLFKETSAVCICEGFGGSADIGDQLEQIYEQIVRLPFTLEYDNIQQQVFLIDGIPNKKGTYVCSILDMDSSDPSYEFIREFNQRMHLPKYAYVKEVDRLMSMDLADRNKALDKILAHNLAKSQIYAKKYNFALRFVGSDLTLSPEIGMSILTDMYFKHKAINFVFDRTYKDDRQIRTIPSKFRDFDGLITSIHMIIDTRNISEWFRKKTTVRYYRPGSKGADGRNLKHIDLTQMVEKQFGTGKISQAWLKMYEILSVFDRLIPNNPTIHSFHLCEAPGNFVAATNHYVRNKGARFEWKAQSLNQKLTGTGFGDDYGYLKKYPNNWDWGADNKGDITTKINMDHYANQIRSMGADFVTSDCGIAREEEAAIGSSMLKIHIAEFVTILKGLQKGRGFVAKYFMPIYLPIEFDIMYILYMSFGKMSFYKPLINIFSLEFYVVCENYGQIDPAILEKLEQILHTTHFDPNTRLFDSYPRTFIEQLLVVSNEIIENYIFNFRRQIYYVDNLHLLNKDQLKQIEYYILKKNMEWIEMTGIKPIKAADRL